MAQVHSSSSITNMTYSPPPLPDYLSRNHTLGAIVGVPTNEEVQAIHDMIRAVNSISTLPALYDHRLSTQLAQYLFTVQMAVYRHEYPSSIFLVENTYTPPLIPSHIPFSLEPVVGAPSDEELESAHRVVRAMENIANSPFFDPALSVKLSQHLFNIQFAHYIQDSNRGQFTQRSTNSQPPPQTHQNEQSSIAPGTHSNVVGQQESHPVIPTESVSAAATLSQAALSGHVISGPVAIPQVSDRVDNGVTRQLEETNRLLGRNEELLKVIGQTLFTTYFSANRDFGQNYNSYRTMNGKGQLPWMHHLPPISTYDNIRLSGSITAQNLVGYLRFYDIGAELIEEGTGNLKPDKEADAQRLLAHYLYYNRPPVTQAA